MVQHEVLTSVLSDFARTLTTDFPIQGILDHLVGRIVDVLPVSAAGVTLISDGVAPHYIAASDASALRYEQLQSDLEQGPCLSAYQSGVSVSVPDLARDDRFPRFGPPAVAAGLAAVWTFPLRHGAGRLGALDLYNDRPGELCPDDVAAAQTLADVAAAYLLNARARDEATAAAAGFQHRSLHDSLTGLPNRAMLGQRLEHAAQRAQRSHHITAVLFADLDRFKLVNDTYGHGAGDELLRAVGRRLTHLVRPGDTLARVSGDEFVFLCEDLNDVRDAETLAHRIHDAFDAPFRLGELQVAISASVGMAHAGQGEAITPQLLDDADVAMYRAKRTGGGSHRIVDITGRGAADERVRLTKDLRDALAGDQLSVHYQPVVRLPTCEVVGVEALLRWEHADRGWVPPHDIVEVAEESGLIHEIGSWVLERACADRARWLALHPSSPLDVAVNVSGRQLGRADYVQTVQSVLERTGTAPSALVLEMTESVLIEDSARVVGVFGRLRDAGVRLALDDFGTGYSSLSYLRTLPVDMVKIDPAFVADLGRDRVCTAVVTAVVQLAHVIGLCVTAEGVETAAQRDLLGGLRCELAQGFLFSAPVPADAISDLLGRAAGEACALPEDLARTAMRGRWHGQAETSGRRSTLVRRE